MNPGVRWVCLCGLLVASCRPASSPVAVANAAGAATATNRFGFDLYDHADHPFLYVIRDPTTGVVLFVGREIDPS